MAKNLEINVTQKIKSFVVSRKLYGLYGWFQVTHLKHRYWFLLFNFNGLSYKFTFTIGT